VTEMILVCSLKPSLVVLILETCNQNPDA